MTAPSPAAARGPVLVVHDGGEQDPVFAGRADAGHGGFGPDLGLDRLLRPLGVEPPEGRGVADLDLPVVDREIDGLGGPAPDDQPVQAGRLERGAEAAARSSNRRSSRSGASARRPGSGPKSSACRSAARS